MKLAAVLACRNQSSRLYAKPLQNLDIKDKVNILDYMIGQIKFHRVIDDIVLAISEQKENVIYQDIAKNYGMPYIIGDDPDTVIERATICKDGNLMPDFEYLHDYAYA